VWSPDGRYVYYSSNRVDDLFRATTDGTGIIEQLTDTATHQYPTSITPDGRRLIYGEYGTATKSDLAGLVLSDEPTSEYLLQTEFNERNGQVSPDGLWLAYESDRSGQGEIYVRPYPDIQSAVWQISSRGGSKPLWAKNSKEIFFWGPTDMMTVALDTQPEFVPGLPEALFDHQDKYALTQIPHFDVDPAGGRFIMVKKPSDESTLTDRIIVVQNWLDEVTQKVGAN
jgi:Tol biopolymer transport system component